MAVTQWRAQRRTGGQLLILSTASLLLHSAHGLNRVFATVLSLMIHHHAHLALLLTLLLSFGPLRSAATVASIPVPVSAALLTTVAAVATVAIARTAVRVGYAGATARCEKVH